MGTLQSNASVRRPFDVPGQPTVSPRVQAAHDDVQPVPTSFDCRWQVNEYTHHNRLESESESSLVPLTEELDHCRSRFQTEESFYPLIEEGIALGRQLLPVTDDVRRRGGQRFQSEIIVQ